ncbi:MAG TPA: ribonuclease J, partial [Paracoccaceae bacterium]|nr:ribonuclease J [Paracoccaceae bacterium]
DPDFISAQAERLDAIFITHGHEDHVGAIGRLWPELKAPIYARRFTARVAELKLEEAGLEPRPIRVVEPWPRMVEAGPFRVGFLPVSHSIPESAALVIETEAGRVVHTGDFKIDHSPQLGEAFDEALFAEIGRLGVDALVCDSTNVFNAHPGRSEAELITPIAELVRAAPGLVVATTFASNLARLRTIAMAAKAAGRSVTVYGRAMNRMLNVARETGILTDFPNILGEDEAASVPPEHLLVLASGSQGERRAAMAQIAAGTSPRVALRPGDLVLFSSKTIPGNEMAVTRVVNRFSEMGARVVDETGGLYHVSGHANRPDLQALHALLRPKLLVPMHGEHRHLVAHVALAEEGGYRGIVAPNGTLVRLAGGPPEIIGQVETGRLYLDGTVLIGALDGVVRDRIKLASRGHVVAAVVVDQDGGLAADPVVRVRGLVSEVSDEVPDLAIALEDAIDLAFERANARQLRTLDAIEGLVTASCSQLCNRMIGRRPVVSVLVSRVEVE